MFGLLESSRTLGEPIALLFVRYGRGAQDFYAFTDSEVEIVVAGVTYAPITVKLDKVHSSGTLDKKSYEFRTPKNNPLVELFRTYPPNEVVSLTISHGHRGDPDSEFITAWAGRILSFGFEGSQAKFTCEPVGTGLRRPGLRRTYSYGCQRVLYSASCGANKLAATVETTVSAITGSVITLPAAWFGAFNPAKFQNGTLEWTTPSGSTVIRTILSVRSTSGTGRDLLLGGLPSDLTVGAAVKAVLGCNHQMSDCHDLHNVIKNYGGCPWIPGANPIGPRNNFY